MFFRRRSQRDFEAEVRSHLELEADRLAGQGLSPEEARHAARRAFGNVTHATERFYESRRVRWLDALGRDLRYALRTLRRSPAFALTAVLTLAFGLGVNTAIFTLIYGIALRPLPVGHPERVVTLFQEMRGKVSRAVFGTPTMISYPEYRDYRDAARTLSGLAAYGEIGVSAAGQEALGVHGQLATCNYFQVLEVPMALGRPFTPEECERPGASPVVVVSDGFWRRRLGSDPAVLGKPLTLNSRVYTIVGVAPRGFGGTELRAAEFWAPVTMQGQLWELDWLANRESSWLTAIGRLAPGVAAARARAELELVARRADASNPGRTTTVVLNRGTLTNNPEMRRLGRVVAVAALTLVGLVVLMACANVMNLLLARAAARRREVGIRLSLGAGRRRLVAQFMTESALLALLGGAAGLLLARWLPPLLLRALPGQQLTVNLAPDLGIFLYAFLLAGLAALGFGLLPAMQESRLDLVAVLKGDAAGGGRSRVSRLRNGVVALEVAGCLLLLIVGGLLTRGVVRARSIDPGFETRNLLVVETELRQAGYDEPRTAAFMRELADRLAALPGVETVAATGSLPLTGRRTTGIRSEGQDVTVLWNVVSGSYFRTMGIPLLRGRTFRADEPRAGAPIPAVITPAFARRFFGERDPLGRQFLSSTDSIRYEVVGVAADVRSSSLAELDGPFFYEAANAARPEGRLLLRTTGDPGALRAAAAQAVRSLDRNVLALVEPMEERLALWRKPVEVGAMLASLLGLLAALVAVVGVYGVVSYAVSQRTREIGVRVALGAGRGDILRLVFRQGLVPVAAGAVIGMALAAGAGQVIRGALYGVSGLDPLAFLGMLGLLLLAASLATLLPARRAIRVDPAVTLRSD
ncbi:MAG TPA: ADOP family duplicated permease [Gemmatimonadales bacterium]|jgi:predicted permease|nr:ADOP family duplicated permease [Gemmatimonadales bacterium]